MAARTVKFETGGMHCSSCPMLIEMTVSEVEGVLEVVADGRSLITEVTFDPAVTSEADIVEAMESVGYTATEAALA